jgi:cellulose synthase/poly-beta-1,6-N-acetylglucosamine synthase-like glycosyltransferase
MSTSPHHRPPFFSILVPSYNRPEFLGVAVDSVLASDFRDFELIVSDDCSPRRAEIAALMEPRLRDSRVQFVPQEANLREPGNRAFLLGSARADWQIFLCDDDKLAPNALGVLASAIEANGDVHLFTFGYTVIDERDRAKYSRRAPAALRINRRSSRVLREFMASEAFPYWFYQPATFCCHRTVRETITPNREIGMGDDLQFLFDYVNAGGTIMVVPEVLMCYRKMNASAPNLQLNQSAARLANVHTRYRMLVSLEKRDDLCPEIRAIVADPEFRCRFVYNSVLNEADAPAGIAEEIAMEKRHRDELAQYCGRTSRRRMRARGYLQRTRLFLDLFGLAGVAEIVRVTAERCGAVRPRGRAWRPAQVRRSA